MQNSIIPMGNKEMYVYLREEYGIHNPTCILKRMKKQAELRYHPETGRFLPNVNFTESEDMVFMTIDELCVSNKNVKESPVEQQPDKSKEMEKLIQELIGDRLLEISRYISINSISKTVIIDKTSLTRDGYQVIMH